MIKKLILIPKLLLQILAFIITIQCFMIGIIVMSIFRLEFPTKTVYKLN